MYIKSVFTQCYFLLCALKMRVFCYNKDTRVKIQDARGKRQECNN